MDNRLDRTIRLLLLVLSVVGGALCLKAAADILQRSDKFPSWFPPLFAGGVAAISVVGMFAVGPFDRTGSGPRKPENRSFVVAVWVFLALSYVCTTAVHAFFPFRWDFMWAWEHWPTVRLNMFLGAFGLASTVVLGALYLGGFRNIAVAILLGWSLILLIPNDDCANPFNVWWIAACGASPLMYVPNLYATIFAVSALRGKYPRSNFALLVVVCVSTLLLGLGHRSRMIW